MSRFLDLGLGISIINVYYSLTYFLMWCVELDDNRNAGGGKKMWKTSGMDGLDRCFFFRFVWYCFRQQRTVCLVSRVRAQPSAQRVSLFRAAQERSPGHCDLVLFDAGLAGGQADGSQAGMSSGRAWVNVPATECTARGYVAIGYCLRFCLHFLYGI